jgi:hypothetical protein
LADKLIEVIEADCNSVCPPAQRADAIEALEPEIDQLVRLDVALVDCAAGAVHDADTPAPALLQVVVRPTV